MTFVLPSSAVQKIVACIGTVSPSVRRFTGANLELAIAVQRDRRTFRISDSSLRVLKAMNATAPTGTPAPTKRAMINSMFTVAV